MGYDLEKEKELDSRIDNEIDTEIKEEIEDYKASGFKEKAKKFLRRARFSRYVSFICIVAAIFVYSLSACGWNPWKIGWVRFLGNVALLLFLAVYGMFFGEGEGLSWLQRHITGLYRTCIVKFRKLKSRIWHKHYTDLLPDYISWRYQRDYERACNDKLISVKLFNRKILNLTYEQLEELRNHPIKIGEGEDDYFDRITEKQYKLLIDIKEGNVFVDYIDDYNYYLMENNSDEGKQLVTIIKETPKRKAKITFRQRVSRLIMVFLSSFIIAGFVSEALEGDNNAAQELISRITTLLLSIASGVNTSRLTNAEDILVLQYKIVYLEVFYSAIENKTFIPTDHNKKARNSYENWLKEQEEAKKNVVYPETIDEEKEPLMIEEKNPL